MADYEQQRKPLGEREVVVHVPRGEAGNIRVQEADLPQDSPDIVVQVSQKRKPGRGPVLGVIVK
jgi:hypothetical protein